MRRRLARPRLSLGTKVTLAAGILALLSSTLGVGAWASFTSTKTQSATYSSGTVTITDNDASVAMLSISNAKPGNRDTSCIKVTYTGSIAATVRLYGSASGTGMGSYVDLTVTRGTISSGAFDSCTNFTADATTYITGQPAGVIYSGSLASFPTTYAAGQVAPTSGSPESWTTNEVHAYKFQLTVGDNATAQGKTVTQTFTWEAR